MAQTSVVLITGAAGWLGGLLAKALRDDNQTPDLHLILADVVKPKAPQDTKAVTMKADLTDPSQVQSLFQTEFGIPDTVYCMHGIMSRGSEDNFDLGIKVNFDSVRAVLDAARQYGSAAGRLIKFIFTSGGAVYGGALPDIVTPSTIATPEGAYGMEKLAIELFVNEYTRRGFIDGRILRLPTIIVRSGVPSGATSGFMSAIIREPLMGRETICPIGDSLDSPELDLAAWVASPTTTIKNFIIAKHIPAEKFTSHTGVVCLPGFSTTIRQELEALENVAGKDTVRLVQFRHDPVNSRIVKSWPARFDISYPLSLGFLVDEGGMVPVVAQFKRDLEAGNL
ncbi:hypothetical protein JAAARDRAFT_609092 [Jaapia argillacea MUCL 33604]|uniref:NAD-dependent epimerase/dehydratase domain-containing protein n=1 Tax=Jaapia argillacea MUCL 33604 TaxID=933084 RepID=A0A067PG72_9AGAM|nr:hypothetical protein JAAARDRAFT_609092 [Jaapia argillacea MUCL 33604]